MSRGATKVVNISASGNRIGDIKDSVREFNLENPGAAGSDHKIIFSVGTNDIKFFHK